MTPELVLAATLRLRHGALADAGAICDALVPLLATEARVVTLVRAHSRLEQRLRGMVPAHVLFEFGRIGIVPAAEDVDLPVSAKLPWPHPQWPAIRRRRLDTFFSSPAEVGLMVVDDPEQGVHLLRGAGRILTIDRPAIVLDLSVLPHSQRLAAWSTCADCLTGTDYTWFDGMLMPCKVDADIVETLGDAAVCALPREGEPVLPYLAKLGWVPPLPPAKPSDTRSVTRLDGEVLWSGADSTCNFFLPLLGPGRWRITFEIAEWGLVGEPNDWLVFAEDQALSFQGRDFGRAWFGDYIVAPLADTGRLLIELTTKRPRPHPGPDPRPFGLKLRQAILERIG